MKLDQKTSLTLIGIFIIAGLCVGGCNSINKEGMDSDNKSKQYLGNDVKSYGGILQLKTLETKYKALIGELNSELANNPLLDDNNVSISYNNNLNSNIGIDFDAIKNIMTGKKLNCSDPSKCGFIKSPDLGTMGGTMGNKDNEDKEEYKEYMEKIRAIEDKLSNVVNEMKIVVSNNKFKSHVDNNFSDSNVTLVKIANREEEISKWSKKVNNMESNIKKAESDLENSKLANKSHYYYYITWFALLTILTVTTIIFIMK